MNNFQMIRVGLIEDDIPFAISLKYFLKNFDDISLCGTAFDLNDSLDLIKNPKYDIILINSSFIDYKSSINTLWKELESHNPSKIIILKSLDKNFIEYNNSKITHSVLKENLSEIPDFIRSIYYKIYSNN